MQREGFELSVPLKSPRTFILLFRPSGPNPLPTLTTLRRRCWAPLSWQRRSTWRAPASWSRFVFIPIGCDKFLPSFLPSFLRITDISVLVVSCPDHWLHQSWKDSEHRRARLQQAGDRGGRALHPRRAVRHPLSGQEEVRCPSRPVHLPKKWECDFS